MHKEYIRPVVTRVALIPNEAALSGCKTTATCTGPEGVPDHGWCDQGGVAYCVVAGS